MIKNMLREVFFSGEDDAVAALAALCPACGFEHSFRVDLTGHGKWNKDVWDFDGNYDSPTFSPSMGFNLGKWNEHHPICHSFLRGGMVGPPKNNGSFYQTAPMIWREQMFQWCLLIPI